VSDIDTVVVDSLKVLDPERPIREEKHEPVSDIDTVVVDSLKVLDPERPIREATLAVHCGNSFDADSSPYQSTRLSRYNAGLSAWGGAACDGASSLVLSAQRFPSAQ
jgi:hypothetical protein